MLPDQAQLRQRIERLLQELLTPKQEVANLFEAMRYACLGGGKRIRALLVYAAGALTRAELTVLDSAAKAVELLHAYSLIHDDLPAMDDDDIRRGRPSCHIVYGEATTILAGDALQALAFQEIAETHSRLATAQILKRVQILAKAAGPHGLCGGQALDLQAVGKTLDIAELQDMHQRKTGALISAAVMSGALSGSASAEQIGVLEKFAGDLGLAFQIADDILDVESSTEIMGKKPGSDRALNKPTYVSALGSEGAKRLLQQLHQNMSVELERTGAETAQLRSLMDFVVDRDH